MPDEADVGLASQDSSGEDSSDDDDQDVTNTEQNNQVCGFTQVSIGEATRAM